MQLHPREKFIVTRQLQNPYITDTFYVRAVIRNSKTDTTIATLDLEDQTGQRFTKEWLVPADPSGLGFYVSIVTSVYDDSGYTTKSQNYGDEETTYLVQDRYIWNPNYPVGADIDYKRIKKMIDEAIATIQIPKPLEQKVVTITKEVVKEVRVPEVRIVESQRSPDLSPILKAIAAVGKKVDDKEVTEVPEQEKIDVSPIIDKIDLMSTTLGKKMDNLKVEIKIANPMVEMVPTLAENKSKDGRITKLMKIK